jgi:hypothetical protein
MKIMNWVKTRETSRKTPIQMRITHIVLIISFLYKNRCANRCGAPFIEIYIEILHQVD